MSTENYIKLKKSSLQGVPFDLYNKDFTFVVNGEEYQTNRVIADILSPAISRLHSTDPTSDRYTINTQAKGDFSKVLSLVNFKNCKISPEEFAFVSEIFDHLDNNSIEIHIEEDQEELTVEKAITNIQNHENHRLFYHTSLEREIDFVSSHFYELSEEQKNKMKNLKQSSIFDIVSNPKLSLKNEDQLLKFINELCIVDHEYSHMYEYVQFVNVTRDSMIDFLNEFDYNELTKSIWETISNRLQQEIMKDKEEDKNNTRYITKTSNSSSEGIKIEFNDNNNFDGIINYLKNQTNDNILDTILNVTPSTLYSSSYPATNLLDDNPSHFYGTQSIPNSWICFEFKNNQVKLTHYKIKTNNGGCNIRNWKLEGSNDNESWELLDEQTNCEYTHGNNKVHTFQINKQQNQKFKYIRLLSTGQDWGNYNYLLIGAIDFYGTIL